MKSKWFVMSSVVLAMLVASIDTTIMNTTMPVIAQELGGMDLFAWSFASYMIFSTVLFPVAGRLADLYGRKKVFAAGIVLFMAGSALCGMAETMVQLIVFRAFQGVGAGVMMPFPMIIAGDLFSVEKRGKIQAVFNAMWGLSSVMAPLVGSAFIEYSTWRWIFFINLPVGALALLLLMPYQEEYRPTRSPIDVLGALLLTGGIGMLLLNTVDFTRPALYFSVGALLLAFFVLYEKAHPHPMVPLELFANRPVAWMIVNGFVASAAMFGTSTYLPLFLQNRGYSVFESGLSLLGVSVGWMALSVPAGKWILRYGYRKPVICANVLLIASSVWFVFLHERTGFWYVFSGGVWLGAAFGLLFTVTTIGSQQLVDAHQKGISTSLQLLSRNIGTVIGVTVMGAIIAGREHLPGAYSDVFLYGLALSAAALLTSLGIKERAVPGEKRRSADSPARS